VQELKNLVFHKNQEIVFKQTPNIETEIVVIYDIRIIKTSSIIQHPINWE